MNSTIPRRIIQIWGGKAELPLLGKAAAVNVRLLNPEFEYFFFDDDRMEDFINKHFPQYRKIFDLFRYPIQRYDFFRYLAIYHLGGFYFDMDVLLASGLSDLLDFGCVFPFEELTMNKSLCQDYGMDWEIGNYAFGATVGHPFLRAIIDNCVKAKKDPTWVQPMLRAIPRMFRDEYYVLYTSGPGLISRTLAEYPNAASEVKVLFPENVCDPTNWNRFGTFGIHLQGGTWRKRHGILRRRLGYRWESWTRKKLLKDSQRLGKSRSLEFKLKTYQTSSAG